MRGGGGGVLAQLYCLEALSLSIPFKKCKDLKTAWGQNTPIWRLGLRTVDNDLNKACIRLSHLLLQEKF